MHSRFELTQPSLPGVAWVSFVPRDHRGVLDAEALDSLARKLEKIRKAGSFRVAVVAGARPDLFAAGASLEDIRRLGSESAGPFADRARNAFQTLEELPLTTVAYVEGACFGGALDLVLCADLIVASPEARFAHPGVRRGIVTGWGGTFRARRRLGEAGLRRLFAEPEELSARQAEANGLVDFIVANREELDRWLAFWAGETGDLLRSLKETCRQVESLSRSQALLVEERIRELQTSRG